MSDVINTNNTITFKFHIPDDETLASYISIKGEKGEKGDPTKLSQLENDTGFITNAVNDLTNYYDKDNSYSRVEVDSLLANSQNIGGKDLNTLIGKVIVGYGNSCLNRPATQNGYFINIPHSLAGFKDTYNLQYWIDRDNSVMYIRHQSNGTFSDWQRVNADMSQYYTKTESDTLRNTNDYYDEVTYTKERYYDTDCYFVTIPMTDTSGDQIKLYVGDAGSGGTPLKYAQTNHTTLTTNGSLAITDTVTSSNSGIPIIIGNGSVLRNHPMISEGVADNYLYVGIKADRSIVEYKVNETDAQTMLNDGCEQVFDVYYKLVENGQATDLTNVVTNEPNVATDKHPRQCIGVQSDGTIIILSCDGRTSINAGLTSAETQTLLLEKGCVQAWNMDGGGSTSTSIKEAKLNRNIDTSGTVDRAIRYTLNVKKTTVNTALAKAYSKISEEKQNLIQQIIPYINGVGAENIPTSTTNINGQNLNVLVDKVYIGYGNGDQNRPSGATTSGYFINIPHSEKAYVGLYARQLYLERQNDRVWSRELVNGTFSDWHLITSQGRAFMHYQFVQSITTDSTYEPVRLNYLYQNTNTLVTPTNYAEGSSTDFYGFKFNRTCNFIIRIELQVKAATSGNKYIRLTRNGSGVNYAVSRFYGVAEQEQVVTLETMNYNTSVNDVYELNFYGMAQDSLERVKIIVEEC